MTVKTIGNIVKEKRKSLNITQSYLAAVANVGVRFISDLENGKETIQLDKVLQVLSTLKIELEIVNND